MWLALSLTLLLVFFFARQNFELYRRQAEYVERAEELAAEIEALEIRESQLEFQMEATSQEAFLERVARERLNLKKPGEEVVVFEVELAEEDTEEPEEIFGFWQRIKNKISNWFKRQ